MATVATSLWQYDRALALGALLLEPDCNTTQHEVALPLPTYSCYRPGSPGSPAPMPRKVSHRAEPSEWHSTVALRSGQGGPVTHGWPPFTQSSPAPCGSTS